VEVLSCEVEPGKLVTAYISSVAAALDADESPGASYWMLKGILYFDPKHLTPAALKKMQVSPGGQPAVTAPPLPPLLGGELDRPERAPVQNGLLLPSTSVEHSRRAASLSAFLQSTDCYWPSRLKIDRDAPIFADHADRRAFYSGCGNSAHVPEVGSVNEEIKLVRRSDQFVSMSRFSEGSAFDLSGVCRAFGYLHDSPPARAPWASKENDFVRVDTAALAAAPFYEGSYLMFYNGNLHNYYHWMAEGLPYLDLLSHALGSSSDLKIALPKSMDICACFDHRESLRAVGLDGREIVEVEANLIRVREVVWVESDLVQHLPAFYLKDFQQRVAAKYDGLRPPRSRRLLVARKGPTRTIHNLEQVQTFLSRYGFETVYLEGMSIRDQILLFQSAEFVISPHGAGLSNLLFCEPGTKVIELIPSAEMRPFFWLISEKLDLVYAMQFCKTVPDQDFQGSVMVDLNKLQALIRMVGAHSSSSCDVPGKQLSPVTG
jgi:capsular polysaccharide biosynthesis protein